MQEYVNQVFKIVEVYPMVTAIASNLILGIIFFLSIYLPKRFIDKELKRIRKNPLCEFDKIAVLIAGMIFSVVFCVAGSEILSGLVLHKIPDEFISILVIFSAVSVLIRALLDSNLLEKKAIPSHFKLYRVSFLSFLTASSFSILSTKFPNYISYGFTSFILLYYFSELYVERRTIDRCFTLLTTKEFSVGIKLIDFMSRNFAFITFLGMAIIPVINSKAKIPMDTVLYINIRDMFFVLAGMFLLQGTSSSIANKFVKKLNDLHREQGSKESNKARKTNWLWICDVIITAYYVTIVTAILWLIGVDIQKYIFHDTIVSIVFVTFGSILICKAFGEFLNSLVDKADPGKREKILTFMPIIKVAFNISLLFVSALIILPLFGIAIIPMLTSLTVVWGALVLAAQDIIKGFLQGVVFLFENNFYIGDWVTINGKNGMVIKISLRTLTLRAANGNEYIIPYNTVGEITNQSREYFLHIENLLVAPNADIDKASDLLEKVVTELKSDPKYSSKIFGNVNIIGINTLSDEGIKICWTLKVDPDLHLLQLEIYKRLFPLLREAKISIPYKQECVNNLQTEKNKRAVK